MTRLRRSCSGQASAEYVAVVLAVALLMAAAVTAAIALNPPFGRQVAATIRQGICIVWSDVCTDADARAAGFAPCPIDVRRDDERLTARAALLKLAHGNAVRVARRSDGTVSVSFMDDEEAGLEVSAGVRLSPLGGASASADAGVTFTKGKTWEFRDEASAKRFLERYAAREGLAGEAKALGRVVGVGRPEGPRLPPAHTTYYEAGPYADLFAGASLGSSGKGGGAARPPKERAAGGREGDDDTGSTSGDEDDRASLPAADAAGRGLTVLGRGRRGRRTTWYVKVGAEAAGQLGGVVGSLQGDGQGEAVLEVAFEDGRPVELRAKGSAAGAGALDLPSGVSDVPAVARRLREAPKLAGSGVVEAEVALDLRDRANHAAVVGFLRPGTSAAEWQGSLRALAARLDAAGTADVRLYSLERAEESVEGEDSFIGGAGLGYVKRQEVRRLTRGWSLAPGGDLRERSDCAEAARPDAVPA